MRTAYARVAAFGGDDRGALSVFVVAFAVVLLVMAGLVVDGGLAINARQKVADDVEQAARAGAQRLDEASLRDRGEIVVNAPEAAAAARQYLAARRYPTADVQVDGNRVRVHAQLRRPTALLSLIFIDHFTVDATGTARPAVGITGEDDIP